MIRRFHFSVLYRLLKLNCTDDKHFKRGNFTSGWLHSSHKGGLWSDSSIGVSAEFLVLCDINKKTCVAETSA